MQNECPFSGAVAGIVRSMDRYSQWIKTLNFAHPAMNGSCPSSLPWPWCCPYFIEFYSWGSKYNVMTGRYLRTRFRLISWKHKDGSNLWLRSRRRGRYFPITSLPVFPFNCDRPKDRQFQRSYTFLQFTCPSSVSLNVQRHYHIILCCCYYCGFIGWKIQNEFQFKNRVIPSPHSLSWDVDKFSRIWATR